MENKDFANPLFKRYVNRILYAHCADCFPTVMDKEEAYRMWQNNVPLEDAIIAFEEILSMEGEGE